MNSTRIIVGIDGSSPGARCAVIWAAEECHIRGCVLVIVHASDPAEAQLVTAMGDAAISALQQQCERTLNEHAAAASERQPGVAVTTRLTLMRAADALIEESTDAELVVVGTRGRGGIVSTMLGSVSHRTAAHAHCPVAVVPETPRPVSPSPRPPRIVVGISTARAGRRALEFAFDEAHRRRATLVAVRAWGTADSGLSDGLDQAIAASWERRADGLLHDVMTALQHSHPDVPVEASAVSGEPAQALLHAADNAQLLIVGGYHTADRWSTRLGPVPTAILHRARCPVVVVGERANRSAATHAATAIAVVSA